MSSAEPVNGTARSKVDVVQEQSDSEAINENKEPSLNYEESSNESENYEVKPEDVLKTGMF